MKIRIVLNLSALVLTAVFAVTVQAVDEYKNSAHGNNAYGVSRDEMKGPSSSNYAIGNCAHCHEQHASVGGGEPAPVNGPEDFMIFDQSNSSQSVNFCFDCHGNGTGYQNGGNVTNRSYSFRAGGWAADPLVPDIQSAFGQASSHNLADILTFVVAQGGWKYTTNSNACAVCHDPHVVQGDPADDSLNPKPSNPTPPVVITEVNSSPVNLWGDIATERMNNSYNYQAPHRVGGPPNNFEPRGDTTANGSNMPDFVAFCTKCHASANVYSTTFSGNLNAINWANEKHGQINVDGDVQMTGSPYPSGAPTTWDLSCLDCHEPHGSVNIYLLRGEVNGGVTTTITGGNQFGQLCSQCHNPLPLAPGTGVNWEDVHHSTAVAPGSLTTVDGPYSYGYGGSCNTSGCHPSGSNPINCLNCHYHGAKTGTISLYSGLPIPPPDQTAALETF